MDTFPQDFTLKHSYSAPHTYYCLFNRQHQESRYLSLYLNRFMSDLYQLWRVEAPRHCDLTFVLFHRHNEGGTCSLSSIFKDVGTVMTLSEGYYTNQKVLRETHVMHITDYTSPAWCVFVCVMCVQSKFNSDSFLTTKQKLPKPPNIINWSILIQGTYAFINSICFLMSKYFTFKSAVSYLLGAIMSVSYKHVFVFTLFTQNGFTTEKLPQL